ncbi:MAG: AI-2E family transporter [Ancrocorticia sp.]|uniref:AI-2E family transporter n=1 Tax=Ancrocorticia sp. TaxID=2593684 RepID=UPI003F8FE21D
MAGNSGHGRDAIAALRAARSGKRGARSESLPVDKGAAAKPEEAPQARDTESSGAGPAHQVGGPHTRSSDGSASTPDTFGTSGTPSISGTPGASGTPRALEEDSSATDPVNAAGSGKLREPSAGPGSESSSDAAGGSSGGQMPGDHSTADHSTGDHSTGDRPAGEPPNATRLQVSTGASKAPAGLKILVVIALGTIALVGVKQAQDIVAPAFFALTLVLTVRPIHRWLIKKGVPAWLSAVVTITTLVATLLSIVGLMVWSLVGLPELVRGYAPAFQNLIQQVMDFAEGQGVRFDQVTSDFLSQLDFGQAVGALTNVVNSVSSIGGIIVLVALALLFITVDTQILEKRAHVVERHDSVLYAALSGFEGRVRQYWLVSTVFGLIVAVFNWGALMFLDVPLPVAWALFSFVTNYIPNVGFVLGVIPPALLGLLDSGWLTAVWVIVAYSAFNAVIQGVFQPKFTGDAVGLSTTVTFLSLMFWTFIVGPLGAILAVPLTLFAKALLIDSSVQTRWMEAFLIPESDARKKEADGYYDKETPGSDTFIDFTAQDSEERKKIQRTLRSLSLRSLRGRTEKK